MLYAIVLAAGESKRMGALKQILPFWKNTVIETIIDSLLKSNIDKVKVVLGHCAGEVLKVLGNREVEVVVNENYRNGMLSSIQCGVTSLPSDTKAFMLCLVDQPTVRVDDINRLIEAYGKSKKGIIIPTYKDRRGHPVIFAKKYIEDITNLKNEGEGLREIVRKNSGDILEVEVSNRGILQDMDTIDDYKKLQKSK